MSDQRHYTRAEFFRAGASGGADAVSRMFRGLFAVRPDPVRKKRVLPIRPPGALVESAFLDACTGCNDCIIACPHSVIRKAGPELGAKVAGTPLIVPEDNPCLFCKDLPCIAACQEGALISPKEGERATIGVAVVNVENCYQVKGAPCDYCSSYCPEKKARAIVAGSFGEAPTVNAAACTGCGTCAQLCPALPKAIRIQPAVGISKTS